MVAQLLTDPNVDPWALDDAANQLQPTYPQTAMQLRQRANQLRQVQGLKDQQSGGSPWTIRAGDIASRLALHYTGNGARWKEIPAVNPGMQVKTHNGTTTLDPWMVGTKILLPVSWQVWNKKPPPVARGSSAKPPTAPTDPTLEQLKRELEKLGSDLLKGKQA